MAGLLRGGTVFVHVPKCGGTWVQAALQAQGVWRFRVYYKHATPEHLNHVLRYDPWYFTKRWPKHPTATPRKLRDAFKFCFVRNPLRWYESYWKFMAGNWHPWKKGRWHPQRPIDACGDDDFNAFVDNVVRTRPGYVSEMYSWYANDLVHYVGRCERLCDDLVEALTLGGERFDAAALRRFPRVNESPAAVGKPVWDPSVLSRAIEAEASGIERFGYWADVEALCASQSVPRSADRPTLATRLHPAEGRDPTTDVIPSVFVFERRMATRTRLRDLGRRVRWILHEIARLPRFWLRTMTRPDTLRIHGVRLRVTGLPRDVCRRLYRERYERGEARLFLAKYDPDDVVMEIGAGIGFISTLCACILGSERVFTYEANPDLLRIARRNYELNGVHPALTNGILAERAGTTTFFVDEHFVSSSVHQRSTANAKKIQVRQLDVKEEMRRIRPTFVIMDIEGSETRLVPLIDWSDVRKLIIELHPRLIGERGVRDVLDRLERDGLRVNRRLSTSKKKYLERASARTLQRRRA